MTEQFLNYLSLERNRSMQTVTRYRNGLQSLEDYFKAKDEGLDWTLIDGDIIRDWMESRLDSGTKATTVNTDLSAVHSFYRFAMARGLVNSDPAHLITGPKKHKPLPVFMRESDMDRLIDQEPWDDSYDSLRARTIIILLYETGLRRGEVVGLNEKDVDLQACQLKVTGKRNKQRIVPFGQELKEALQHYIEVRNDVIGGKPEALFLDKRGRRVTGKQVYDDVKKNLSRVSSQKKRSPHVLRHSFATAMLNHQAGLESVRQLLGHESLQTTEIYTHTTFEQLRRVYKEAHPRG